MYVKEAKSFNQIFFSETAREGKLHQSSSVWSLHIFYILLRNVCVLLTRAFEWLLPRLSKIFDQLALRISLFFSFSTGYAVLSVTKVTVQAVNGSIFCLFSENFPILSPC